MTTQETNNKYSILNEAIQFSRYIVCGRQTSRPDDVKKKKYVAKLAEYASFNLYRYRFFIYFFKSNLADRKI